METLLTAFMFVAVTTLVTHVALRLQVKPAPVPVRARSTVKRRPF
ncbi:hypothetical protein [Candidatus Halocynthiibacter alkanivorans]|jgi:hypothetical protein|nr:hypothetical protein [Candidatus Halocynthiibacter alkanivorans]